MGAGHRSSFVELSIAREGGESPAPIARLGWHRPPAEGPAEACRQQLGWYE